MKFFQGSFFYFYISVIAAIAASNVYATTCGGLFGHADSHYPLGPSSSVEASNAFLRIPGVYLPTIKAARNQGRLRTCNYHAHSRALEYIYRATTGIDVHVGVGFYEIGAVFEKAERAVNRSDIPLAALVATSAGFRGKGADSKETDWSVIEPSSIEYAYGIVPEGRNFSLRTIRSAERKVQSIIADHRRKDSQVRGRRVETLEDIDEWARDTRELEMETREKLALARRELGMEVESVFVGERKLSPKELADELTSGFLWVDLKLSAAEKMTEKKVPSRKERTITGLEEMVALTDFDYPWMTPLFVFSSTKAVLPVFENLLRKGLPIKVGVRGFDVSPDNTLVTGKYGGHAMIVVGLTDGPQRKLVLQNSWGGSGQNREGLVLSDLTTFEKTVSSIEIPLLTPDHRVE